MTRAGQKKNLDNISMLVMDVDGVLTDGIIIINDDGSESKSFSVFDGHRIKMWFRAGLECAILSGRDTNATRIRADQLGIKIVLQGCVDKVAAFEELLEQTSLSAESICYIGDDLVDIPLIKRAGFGVAVASAAAEVIEAADFVTSKPGGAGAVGELIEYILKNTGRWQQLMQKYLI